jgi:hypothetical protein
MLDPKSKYGESCIRPLVVAPSNSLSYTFQYTGSIFRKVIRALTDHGENQICEITALTCR